MLVVGWSPPPKAVDARAACRWREWRSRRRRRGASARCHHDGDAGRGRLDPCARSTVPRTAASRGPYRNDFARLQPGHGRAPAVGCLPANGLPVQSEGAVECERPLPGGRACGAGPGCTIVRVSAPASGPPRDRGSPAGCSWSGCRWPFSSPGRFGLAAGSHGVPVSDRGFDRAAARLRSFGRSAPSRSGVGSRWRWCTWTFAAAFLVVVVAFGDRRRRADEDRGRACQRVFHRGARTDHRGRP